MTLRERESLLNRIFLGYYIFTYKDKKYKIKPPSKRDLYLADLLYDETLYEANFENFLTENQVEAILQNNGIWRKEDENKLKKMEEQIEELKVKIYESRLDAVAVNKLKKTVASLTSLINQSYEKKHSLDHLTSVGYANLLRRQFLLERQIKNPALVHKIFTFLSDQTISVEDFRELARSEPWKSYWEISKPKPFKKHYEDWTEDQKTLVRYSKMYDGIFSHPECPSEQVINDDLMLDGWIILQNRKSEKEKSGDSNSLVSGDVSRHKEQFISPKRFTKTKEGDDYIVNESLAPELKNVIENLNDGQAKLVKKQRQSQIDKAGAIKETDLLDVKIDLLNQKNRRG